MVYVETDLIYFSKKTIVINSVLIYLNLLVVKLTVKLNFY